LELERPRADQLVGLLGAHPATLLGLDLDAHDDADLGAWLVATLLLGGRTREDVALVAFRRLRSAGLASPAEIAENGINALHAQLEAADVPKSEAVAAVLTRVCTKFTRDSEGSIDRLASDCDGLEDLARRLAGLGSGFGRAAVLRFLTPLRDRWSAANDLPSTQAVCSAASDLGLIPGRDDAEGAPAAIALWLRNEGLRNEGLRNEGLRNEVERGDVPGTAPAPRDVEAALERLGKSACLRERADRCPLGSDCPLRRNAREAVRD
jgi:hypothetical protein